MKTKLFLTFFAGFFLLLQTVQGQANYNYNNQQEDFLKNEVHLEYGVVTTQSVAIRGRQLLSDISVVFLDALIEKLGYDSNIGYERDFTGTRGAIGIGYSRYLVPRWTIGATVNYHGFETAINFDNGQQAFIKDRFYTFLVDTDYRWVNQPGVQLYSGLCLGASYWRYFYEKPDLTVSNHTFFNMQFTPIGIRVGNQIGGFFEFGLGSNGLLVGGISGRF
ncbi:MAG: hypothetical protein IPL49_01160 [Saprospirales bacterium]|nr:hypothetical protein [Saprospirales bacterium]MBK8489527.1 hypothetical protein [Saprospirales bacterium]